MKNLIFLSILSILGLGLNAQTSIKNALNEGNAEKLISFIGDEIELCFYNEDDIYSKKEASLKLHAFFKENSPVSFVEKHSGGRQKSKYLVGLLKAKERNFRVFIYVERSNEKTLIREMRFERPRN